MLQAGKRGKGRTPAHKYWLRGASKPLETPLKGFSQTLGEEFKRAEEVIQDLPSDISGLSDSPMAPKKPQKSSASAATPAGAGAGAGKSPKPPTQPQKGNDLVTTVSPTQVTTAPKSTTAVTTTVATSTNPPVVTSTGVTQVTTTIKSTIPFTTIVKATEPITTIVKGPLSNPVLSLPSYPSLGFTGFPTPMGDGARPRQSTGYTPLNTDGSFFDDTPGGFGTHLPIRGSYPLTGQVSTYQSDRKMLQEKIRAAATTGGASGHATAVRTQASRAATTGNSRVT